MNRTTSSAVVTMLALLAVGPSLDASASPEAVQAIQERLSDNSCAVPSDTPGRILEERVNLINESPWQESVHVGDAGELIPEVYKTVKVAVHSREDATVWTDAIPGDDETGGGPGVENCSAGVCTVTVHVYANSTTEANVGVGVFAFLPFFFRLGGSLQVEQQTSTTSYSEIECEGSLFVGLNFRGGVLPQYATASILKTNAEQHTESCTYLNILPEDSCSVLFTGEWSIKAGHGGNYTRFDIINGGYFQQSTAIGAAGTMVQVQCIPNIGIYTDPIWQEIYPGQCLGPAGQWRTVFKGIEIDVDTTEGVCLLLEQIPGRYDDQFCGVN